MNVPVELGDRSYQVEIASGLLDRVPDWLGAAPGRPVAVVGDARLRDRLDAIAGQADAAGHPASVVAVDATEQLKTLAAIEPVYGRLMEAGLDRHSTIVGVGGGTIGDAIGFVAATYVRGIRFINVPTTLLAAVDSAIGGKTGLNHALGKNLIGTFAQPAAVIVDPQVFASLEPRDRISGLGEIAKYALIADPLLYLELRARWREIAALDGIERIVARCAAIKAAYVSADEFDRNGRREHLNLGHTVAHAVERELGYGLIRHGEAVIVGLRAAVELSRLRGHLTDALANDIDAHLSELPVPAPWATLAAEQIAGATAHDKKRTAGGRVRFVLIAAIGRAVGDDGVTGEELVTALRRVGFA